MRGSRNFRQADKKSSNNGFFGVFLVLSLFYRSQMVNFKEIYHFSRFQMGSNIFQRGSNIFQGGPTFSRGGGGGGSNCLFPIETNILAIFQEGSGPPVPPLDPHFGRLKVQNGLLKTQTLGVSRENKPPPNLHPPLTFAFLHFFI